MKLDVVKTESKHSVLVGSKSTGRIGGLVSVEEQNNPSISQWDISKINPSLAKFSSTLDNPDNHVGMMVEKGLMNTYTPNSRNGCLWNILQSKREEEEDRLNGIQPKVTENAVGLDGLKLKNSVAKQLEQYDLKTAVKTG